MQITDSKERKEFKELKTMFEKTGMFNTTRTVLKLSDVAETIFCKRYFIPYLVESSGELFIPGYENSLVKIINCLSLIFDKIYYPLWSFKFKFLPSRPILGSIAVSFNLIWIKLKGIFTTISFSNFQDYILGLLKLRINLKGILGSLIAGVCDFFPSICGDLKLLTVKFARYVCCGNSDNSIFKNDKSSNKTPGALGYLCMISGFIIALVYLLYNKLMNSYPIQKLTGTARNFFLNNKLVQSIITTVRDIKDSVVANNSKIFDIVKLILTKTVGNIVMFLKTIWDIFASYLSNDKKEKLQMKL